MRYLEIRRRCYYHIFRKVVKINAGEFSRERRERRVIYLRRGIRPRETRVVFADYKYLFYVALLSAPLLLYSYVGAYCVTARRLLSIESTITRERPPP